MCEKLQFFHNPRGGQIRHFFAQFFFSLNIDSDHRSVHLGWFIWVFWEFMMKKMINFLAQRHIKVFLEFKLFWILNFLEVWCVKNYHFFTAPWWSEKALFCKFFFFFSEYQFWSQVGASGVVYLCFLRIYDEKND